MNATRKPSLWDFFRNLAKPRRLLSTLAIAGGLAFAASALLPEALAQAPAKKKPNVLVIWGDDIGYWNVSAYNVSRIRYWAFVRIDS